MTRSKDVDPTGQFERAQAEVAGISHEAIPPKLDSIEPEAGGLHTVALIFQNGTPTVNKGDCRVFCALMVSRHTGKDLVLPLYYLNQMPLEKEECDCAEEHDEGCPTTGWFYDNSNFDYDNCYWPAEGEVVAWADLPKAEVVRSAFTRRASPAPVAVPAGYRLVPDAARHAKSLREVAAVLSTERIQGWANPLVTLLTDAAEAIAPQPLPANAGQWVLSASPVPVAVPADASDPICKQCASGELGIPEACTCELAGTASPVPSTATQAGAVTRTGNETDGGAE